MQFSGEFVKICIQEKNINEVWINALQTNLEINFALILKLHNIRFGGECEFTNLWIRLTTSVVRAYPKPHIGYLLGRFWVYKWLKRFQLQLN